MMCQIFIGYSSGSWNLRRKSTGSSVALRLIWTVTGGSDISGGCVDHTVKERMLA